ncbi:MAG: 4-(cytidine 5'-diphospho)-2-C-methyl-D-erythritol kinase [Nitrospirae bacterium]|nr:4-(cytidine 5'-diphospho)-2-C-methyl-D-erythritol kinase [Nitrospirota bacterium]
MLTLQAPAKINWSLYVLNKRDDGYHNILSLMQCIGLYDTLSFEYSDGIELVSDMDIQTHQNLVFKAARMLQQHAGTKNGARIILEKEIPSGAGLGGGSSDAAYTLIGLNKLWGLGIDSSELKSIGSELGSDVPFFFDCPIAIAQGRGEMLTPLKLNAAYTLLLVKPPVSVSTAWAYEAVRSASADSIVREGVCGGNLELTKIDNKINNIQLIYRALNTGDIYSLRSMVHNDFEDVVIKQHQVIGDIKDKLLECGALLALMSGSGSAVFGLFEDRDTAISSAGHFSRCFNRVVNTLTD